jgi:hypothetical protein
MNKEKEKKSVETKPREAVAEKEKEKEKDKTWAGPLLTHCLSIEGPAVLVPENGDAMVGSFTVGPGQVIRVKKLDPSGAPFRYSKLDGEPLYALSQGDLSRVVITVRARELSDSGSVTVTARDEISFFSFPDKGGSTL